MASDDGPRWWDHWERIVPEIAEAVQSRCNSGATKDALPQADAIALSKAKEVARKSAEERQRLKTTGAMLPKRWLDNHSWSIPMLPQEHVPIYRRPGHRVVPPLDETGGEEEAEQWQEDGSVVI
eukprot:Skav236076  [mRNA]  locus=scaffold2211:252182:260722:- [translate_table: standard]